VDVGTGADDFFPERAFREFNAPGTGCEATGAGAAGVGMLEAGAGTGV